MVTESESSTSAAKWSLARILGQHVDSADDIYVRIAVYPLAVPVTWSLVNYTRITANQITLCGLLSGVAGCLTSTTTNDLRFLLGGFLVFFVLDFVDGQVASVKGGTRLGATLDLVTDRTVLFLSIGTLAYHHFRAGATYELLLLIVYLAGYAYMDALILARGRAGNRRIETPAESTPNKQRGWGARPAVWILFPTRLSSPLFFSATLIRSDSFVLAYYAALVAVLAEYTMLLLRAAVRWLARVR